MGYTKRLDSAEVPLRRHPAGTAKVCFLRDLSLMNVSILGSAEEFATIVPLLRPEQVVIDFVRIRQIEENHANCAGIYW
jgi:hypothetical protein